MTWPVPTQYPISTAYGKRGSYWSCNEDSNGNGVHTGADFAAPLGTPLYATIDGQIRWRSYGSAFGNHQFAISPDPGQPFEKGEVFYAHARKRLADGVYVKAGDWVGEVGDEGNVTGAHLHYEFHPNNKNVWNCSVHSDPAPTLEGSTVSDAWEYFYSGKPSGTQRIGTSYVDVDLSKWNPAKVGVEFAMVYLNCSAMAFAAGKSQGALRIRAVRADGDKSSYHDYPLGLDFSDGGEQLITHVYFEKGDGGDTHYEVKCIGGLVGVTLGTRYRKGAIDY
jgi:hypothetical protein